MRRRWFWEATETRFSSRELRANRVRLAQTFVPLVVRIVFNVLGIQTLSNRNHRASGDLFETRFQRRRPTSRRGLTRSLVSRRGRPLGPVLHYGRVAPEEPCLGDGAIKTNFLSGVPDVRLFATGASIGWTPLSRRSGLVSIFVIGRGAPGVREQDGPVGSARFRDHCMSGTL